MMEHLMAIMALCQRGARCFSVPQRQVSPGNLIITVLYPQYGAFPSPGFCILNKVLNAGNVHTLSLHSTLSSTFQVV